MTQKRILMLSVSAGAGHTRAAEALLAGAAKLGLTAVHLDVVRFVTPLMRKLYTDVYMFLVQRAPSLWRFVYQATNDARPDGPMHRLRRWAERRGSRALLAEIARFKPDVIVCTHFLPAEILSQLIGSGGLQCQVWVQVTDFDVHRMWVHRHMAGYFAPNEEVAYRLRELGIAADAVHVTGIPVMPAFAAPPERSACAREFGIDPRRTSLLVMGGGAGIGSLPAVAEHLLGMDEHFQLIVLAGKNAAALDALMELAVRYPGRLAAQGYTEQVERLMACADLAVTKPGGLTTSECLAMGLPMIVNAPIPGQEEQNANYLLEQGAALKASDLATLAWRIRYLLAHPGKLADMRTRARALGRPNAACHVLATILERTER